jgi:imidazolonepropionase-like amidohydrolase
MNLLIKNIKQLIGVDEHKLLRRAGKEMKEMHVIENAFLYIENGKISFFRQHEKF